MHYQLQGQIHLIKPIISVPIDQQGEINLGKLLPKL